MATHEAHLGAERYGALLSNSGNSSEQPWQAPSTAEPTGTGLHLDSGEAKFIENRIYLIHTTRI